MLVLLLSLLVESEGVLRDRVDVIEINHHCDGTGSLVFDQIIFWRWCRYEAEYRVVGWRMLRDVREAPKRATPEPDGWQPRPKWRGGHATPLRRHDRGGWWISTWRDERDKCWRQVAAPMFRETWTVYDPELLDREFLPQHKRVGLRKHDGKPR